VAHWAGEAQEPGGRVLRDRLLRSQLKRVNASRLATARCPPQDKNGRLEVLYAADPSPWRSCGEPASLGARRGTHAGPP
jgi:hypothetical protein